MSNILTVPTFELKAFLTLSKGKPTNTNVRTLYSPCGRCLLVDISGKRVQLTHTNLTLKNKTTALDLDGLRATFVADNYLQGVDFSILCQKHKQGKHADGSTFDLGYLQAVTRYFKDAKCSRVNVTYPQQAFEPLQWDYGVGDYAALLMPIRR